MLTGCPDPGLEQYMVYLRMIPLGLVGGSHDTTTLLDDDGTALMPAGGPGSGGKDKSVSVNVAHNTLCEHNGFRSELDTQHRSKALDTPDYVRMVITKKENDGVMGHMICPPASPDLG